MNNPRTGILIGAIVLLVIIVVVGLFTMQEPAPPPPNAVDPGPPVVGDNNVPPPVELSPEQTAELLSKHHRGIAYLENGEYDKSEPLLAELADSLPKPATLRNLAINQVLALGGVEISSDDGEKQEQMKKAAETIFQWKKIEKDASLAGFLLGKIAVLSGDITSSLFLFDWELSSNPIHAYAVYDTAKNSPTDYLKMIGAKAIKKAHSHAPDNLWIICELLISQLENEDTTIRETISRADESFDFLKPGILKRTRLDLDESFDAARDALTQSDWNAVAGQIRRVVNVARPEVAVQLDRGKVAPHLLEFVAFDIGLPRQTLAVPGESIEVKLVAEATEEESLNIEGLKTLTLIDFDLDGKLDIVAATDRVLYVLSRTGDSETWTSLFAYESPKPITGIVLVDLDRDTNANTVTDNVGCATADVDVITFGAEGVQILLNELSEGSRELQPVEQNEAFQQLQGVLTVATVDFDHEGDLDLVVSSETGLSFWTNLGNMQFEKLEGRAELPPDDFHATQILPFDQHGNIPLDLLLWDDASSRAGCMNNLRHAEFRWEEWIVSDINNEVSSQPNVARNSASRSRMMITNFVSNPRVKYRRDLVRADEEGLLIWFSFFRYPDIAGLSARTVIDNTETRDVQALDYDNDGKFDIVSAGIDGLKLWHADQPNKFSGTTDVLSTAGIDDVSLKHIQLLAVGDLDADGDIDVAAATDERIFILRNDGGNNNNWLDVALRAQATPDRPQERVNIHGLGSTLEVKIGDEYMTRVVSEPVTHFGLGQHKTADVVRLVWPNGLPFSVIDPPANVAICEEQRLLSSCAFLYAWNGERFDFITDLLWNAPIGLPIAEGVYIPPREWEYLHIPGERLQPQDGFYTLQVTEELWEAAYFDEIELIAVDHPADVEIVSNEKVGPPSVAEYKLHTVSERRVPIKAVNHQGRDLMPEILNEDDVYAQPFDRRIKQGLVDEHFVELDLGDLKSPQQIILFLRGWMYPTGPSVNIAISQNPNVTPPRPPAISVPDANGEWQEVIPFTGFPGGKAKTIAIDLSKAFLTDDYRLRLSTNMEFYWDAAYFTVDEPNVELKETVLPIASADLHFRGLSRMTLDEHNGPEHFDYDGVITEPFWSPMQGKFTRFGDVRELITATDDLLLVMGAGDEVTIRWQVPEPPLPSGWKRDFILHNVGWNKDDDLNTAYGHQVEPLPFVGMPHYPYDVIPERLQTDAYLHYLKTYQTRTQTGRFIGHRP